MAIGYRLADGTDLDLVFKARGGSTPAADTGFNPSGAQDLADRYYASTGVGDRIASNTGYRLSDGTDLKNVFRDIDYPDGPVIDTQPTNQTVNEGADLTLTIVAHGVGTLHYQWSRDVGAGWVNVGTDSDTLTYSPSDRADQGSYKCTVTDDDGFTVSDVVTGTVDYPPAITVDPSGGTLNETDAASLSVTASAGQPSGISYQWKRNGVTINSGTDGGGKFSGYNAATMTFLCDYRDNTTFTCVVSNSAGSDESAAATLDVHYLPIITSQPSGHTGNEGDDYTLSVIAHGNTSPSYQWQKSNDGSTGWTNVSGGGATTDTYTKTNPPPLDLYYRCVITNDRGTTYSSVVHVIVRTDPYITANPSGGTYTDGVNPMGVQCSAGGDGTLYFEWFFDDGGGYVSLNAPRTGNLSATQDQYVVNPVHFADAGSYYCQVTNSHGGTPANSSAATITVV